VFHDGNSYMKLERIAKNFYIQGLIDGMSFMKTDLFNMSQEHSVGIPWQIFFAIMSADKFKDMTSSQIVAIFDKYLEEHPKEWHYRVSSIFIG